MFALVIVIDMYMILKRRQIFYVEAPTCPCVCVNKNKIKTPPVTKHTTRFKFSVNKS